MPVPLDTLGSRHFTTATVDPQQVRAYVEATNDTNPAYSSGALAPPVFSAIPSWDPMIAALYDVMPPDRMPKLLHALQDMRFHAPLVPGTTLATEARLFGVNPTRSGTWVTIRSTSNDVDSGVLVMEQYGTMFVRGWNDVPTSGAERPEHGFAAAERGTPLAEVSASVDADQTLRYADASGDRNAIHVDDEFARGVGLPGIILHGMCTMAICAQAVIERTAGGDPTRLRRLAVRFSKPVLPGSDLVTTIYSLNGAGAGDDSGGTYGFEATSRGERVIRDGRAEIG